MVYGLLLKVVVEATDWTVSDQGRSLAGTTVTSGYIRATYTLSKGDYLVSLRWTGGAFAVQDSTGYIVTTDGSSTSFSLLMTVHTVSI